ncbi:TPA: hypothetical protein EYP66_01835 [Candidatus Poribacteria bacterium]|nr:hypothetical protein [Candidatus Poribacteria bacterium]
MSSSIKGKNGYTEALATSATVVDVLDGHVHEIEGDVVYAKYLINGEEYEAAFDIALFKEVDADFQGARVRFLTIKTEVLATSATDESTPYDLKIELKRDFISLSQHLQKVFFNIAFWSSGLKALNLQLFFYTNVTNPF